MQELKDVIWKVGEQRRLRRGIMQQQGQKQQQEPLQQLAQAADASLLLRPRWWFP